MDLMVYISANSMTKSAVFIKKLTSKKYDKKHEVQ